MIEAILDFCRDCKGHITLPTGDEFYICLKLGAFAQIIDGYWTIFFANEERLQRLMLSGKIVMLLSQKRHGGN